MSTNAVWESVHRFHKVGEPTTWRSLNVLHWVGAYAGVKDWNSTGQDIANTISQKFADCVKGCLAADWYYAGLTMYQVTNDLRTLGKDSTIGAGAGTQSEPGLPSQNAFIIKKRTTNAGRAWRGRMYLPGQPFESANGAVWTNGWMATVAAAGWTAFLTLQINVPAIDPDAVLRCCLAKPPFDPVKAGEKALFSIALDNVIRAQRRRQPGRGY